jgi:ribose-phosphate pyrophosphokinase
LDTSLAIIIKHRESPGKVSGMHLVGDVKNKDVIIIDDMIDTAGTLCHAVD